MATQQLQLIADQSTYANFFQWASAISAWFATCGWLQSVDTGQEMWSGMSLTTVSGISGSSATYTYTSLTGLALAIGRTLTITGMTHSINNGTFRITGLGAGTFTITNQNGTPLAESGSTGVVTAASSVPGSGAFVYEIWQPGDGLQNFYVKIQYGNVSGTNQPGMFLGLSTSTNGAGTPSGVSIVTPFAINQSGFTPPSTTLPFECNFSGDTGRMHVMMWRNCSVAAPMVFSIERSVNSSGTYTGTHVTLITIATSNNGGVFQQSIVFGVGAAPKQSSNGG